MTLMMILYAISEDEKFNLFDYILVTYFHWPFVSFQPRKNKIFIEMWIFKIFDHIFIKTKGIIFVFFWDGFCLKRPLPQMKFFLWASSIWPLRKDFVDFLKLESMMVCDGFGESCLGDLCSLVFVNWPWWAAFVVWSL